MTDPPYGIGERSGTISKLRNRNDYDEYVDTRDNIIAVIAPAFEKAMSLAVRGIMTPGPKCAWLYPEPVDIGMLYQPASCGMTHWGRCTCQPVLFYGKDPMSGKTIQPLHYESTKAADPNGHPCPKPIGVMEWMVGRGSVAGETVLDPFMGSGTTGVACAKMGRSFIGIEISEDYFNIACQRIEDAYRQGDMFVESS